MADDQLTEETAQTEATEQDDAADDEHQDDDGTYPAKFVKDLRKENANYRERVNKLSRELFTARVQATGKVENATEVPFNADILDDADAINAAVDAAVAERPYIAKRKVSGSIGQGERGTSTAPQDFSNLLRG